MPSMMLQYFVHKNVLRFYDGKKINLKKKKVIQRTDCSD